MLGRSFLVFLALTAAAAMGGSASAADYDWRDPGKAEVEAVLSALGKSGTEAVDDLLDDGLGVDQFLPLKNNRVPLLSLALGAGRTEVVENLLDEGAEVDLMSTRDMRRTEHDQYTVKVRKK